MDIINILIDYENLDHPNLSGWTPLHRASYNARIQACEVLLVRGASLLSVDKEGNTPLHLACKANHIQTVEFLLTWEPNIELENHEGQQATDLCSPYFADAVKSILAEHTNRKSQTGSSRQENRRGLTRTTVAPIRAKSILIESGITDPTPVSSTPEQVAGSFSLEHYPSFGHKDAQGFPLLLEEETIHIRPSSEEAEMKPDAEQLTSQVESPREPEVEAWTASACGGEMTPWESEAGDEGRKFASTTEDCLAPSPEGRHVVRDPRRSQSMVVGRQKKPHVQFLSKYNLQKYHLFGP